MSAGDTPVGNGRARLGRELRRAAVCVRQQVETALADVGFADWQPPDRRALFICATTPDVTISDIGRTLNITRQGAGKIVAGLRDHGYLTTAPSPADGREKTVTLTARAREFLRAQEEATVAVEAKLRALLGDEGVEQLYGYLELITDGCQLPDHEDLPRRRDWRTT